MGGLLDGVKKDSSLVKILPTIKPMNPDEVPEYPFDGNDPDEKSEMTDAEAKGEIAMALIQAEKEKKAEDKAKRKKTKKDKVDEAVEVANDLFGEEEKPKKKKTRKTKKSTAKKPLKKKKSTGKKIVVKKPKGDLPEPVKDLPEIEIFSPEQQNIAPERYTPPAPEFNMVQYKVPTLQIAKRLPTNDEILYMIERHKFVKATVVDKNDYVEIGTRNYLKKSGWRKFINAFGISIELVSRRTWEEYDDTHAEVIVRAITPNGQSVEGIGIKSMKDIYSDRNLHNLVATAWTRAVNRAVADLVAFGEVSAEEMATGSAGSQSLF